MAVKTKATPPRFYAKQSYHILKRFDQPIRIEQFRRMLEMIGWTLYDCGHEHYQLQNPAGRATQFQCRPDGTPGTGEPTIKIKTTRGVFEDEEYGSIGLGLKECQIAIFQSETLFIYARASDEDAESITLYLNNRWRGHRNDG